MRNSDIASPYAPYIDPEGFGQPNLERLMLFDTSLRDGEQTPGASLGPEDKAHLARYIAMVGVDAMEVSFAISDPNEIRATRMVAEAIGQDEDQAGDGRDVVLYSLARALPDDVDAAAEAVKSARLPGIHTFISTSEPHFRAKFPGKKWEDIRDMLVESTGRAAEHIVSTGKYGMVEISAEDALRTPKERLIELYTLVREVARPYQGKVGFTFNIPDTVGVVVHPKRYGNLITDLRQAIPDSDEMIWSAHVHNDHGMAVVSSLFGVENGVRQIEGTITGIGERAGNSSLDQVIMALAHDVEGDWGVKTGADPEKIWEAALETSIMTGYHPGRNAPVVGSNAQGHESGIHQHGTIKGWSGGDMSVYEGVTAEEVGAPGTRITLGRRSGIEAITHHLETMGYELPKTGSGKIQPDAAETIYDSFLAVATERRGVSHTDLRDIMDGLGYQASRPLPVEYIDHEVVKTNDPDRPPRMANVTLRIEGGEPQVYTGFGVGEFSAVVDAVKQAVGNGIEVKRYNQSNVGGIGDVGSQSFARTELTMIDKATGRAIIGEAYDPDIGKSAAHAFVNGLNTARYQMGPKGEGM